MEAGEMVALTDKGKDKNILTANEEFDKYLMEQRTSTTFNGMEVDDFSCYKRFLGLKS